MGKGEIQQKTNKRSLSLPQEGRRSQYEIKETLSICRGCHRERRAMTHLTGASEEDLRRGRGDWACMWEGAQHWKQEHMRGFKRGWEWAVVPPIFVIGGWNCTQKCAVGNFQWPEEHGYLVSHFKKFVSPQPLTWFWTFAKAFYSHICLYNQSRGNQRRSELHAWAGLEVKAKNRYRRWNIVGWQAHYGGTWSQTVRLAAPGKAQKFRQRHGPSLDEAREVRVHFS